MQCNNSPLSPNQKAKESLQGPCCWNLALFSGGLPCFLGCFWRRVDIWPYVFVHFSAFSVVRYIVHTCPNLQCNPCSKCYTLWTASVHTLHMSKPNVTRVQSATEWTASVHTRHMPKPNVTRVQSATEWTASVHSGHMSKPAM